MASHHETCRRLLPSKERVHHRPPLRRPYWHGLGVAHLPWGRDAATHIAGVDKQISNTPEAVIVGRVELSGLVQELGGILLKCRHKYGKVDLWNLTLALLLND